MLVQVELAPAQREDRVTASGDLGAEPVQAVRIDGTSQVVVVGTRPAPRGDVVVEAVHRGEFGIPEFHGVLCGEHQLPAQVSETLGTVAVVWDERIGQRRRTSFGHSAAEVSPAGLRVKFVCSILCVAGFSCGGVGSHGLTSVVSKRRARLPRMSHLAAVSSHRRRYASEPCDDLIRRPRCAA